MEEEPGGNGWRGEGAGDEVRPCRDLLLDAFATTRQLCTAQLTANLPVGEEFKRLVVDVDHKDLQAANGSRSRPGLQAGQPAVTAAAPVEEGMRRKQDHRRHKRCGRARKQETRLGVVEAAWCALKKLGLCGLGGKKQTRGCNETGCRVHPPTGLLRQGRGHFESPSECHFESPSECHFESPSEGHFESPRESHSEDRSESRSNPTWGNWD
eukprot:365436-Chlamydomonas_euryale.AAC.8